MIRHDGIPKQPMPMQAARSTAPREVADEVRLQEKRAARKAVREDEALKTKIAKDRQQHDVVWQVWPCANSCLISSPSRDHA